MFTGLIEDLGTVESAETTAEGAELWLRTSIPCDELALGESISHNGVCLTVVQRERQRFRVQASLETMRRTTLGRWRTGDSVNLERALKLGARLGGHLVLGHVDGVGRLLERRREGASEWMRFSLPRPLAPLLIEKGSVTLDGISLTVNALDADSFTVMAIPETLLRTTLSARRLGDEVNLEGDVIGKYVARLRGLERAADGTPTSTLTEEALRKAGFGW